MPIEKNYAIPAPVDQVFDAWISNDYVVPPVARVVVDPEPDGRFHLHMSEETGAGIMRGQFRCFEPNARLVYSWLWDWSPNVSTHDVRFTANGDATNIHLAHSGLDTDDSIEKHSEGWDAYLEGLTALLTAKR